MPTPLGGLGLQPFDTGCSLTLTETEAEALFQALKLRLPVLSLRHDIALTIPGKHPTKTTAEHQGVVTGAFPSLIPADLEPRQIWAEGYLSSHTDGENLLGLELDDCPPVDDKRIQTAIDLVIASRYDTLARSVFLSHLTAIDSLAVRSDRSEEIRSWLDEKIEEARNFNDRGLVTSLESIKQDSHGTAIRRLVGQAACKMAETGATVEARQRLATTLYRIRSGLSHAGAASLSSENVEQARQLTRFLIDVAVQFPGILSG